MDRLINFALFTILVATLYISASTILQPGSAAQGIKQHLIERGIQ